ncbi:hypothetical protein PENTCL1PPCAC_13311, partial [Pristionchus entomophagus]
FKCSSAYMRLFLYDIPNRPLFLATIYTWIICATQETLGHKEDLDNVELGFYIFGVLFSGWIIFTILEALMNTIDVILKALLMMAIGGIIITPYYYYPGSWILITVSWLLVFCVPPITAAYCALGG